MGTTSSQEQRRDRRPTLSKTLEGYCQLFIEEDSTILALNEHKVVLKEQGQEVAHKEEEQEAALLKEDEIKKIANDFKTGIVYLQPAGNKFNILSHSRKFKLGVIKDIETKIKEIEEANEIDQPKETKEKNLEKVVLKHAHLIPLTSDENKSEDMDEKTRNEEDYYTRFVIKTFTNQKTGNGFTDHDEVKIFLAEKPNITLLGKKKSKSDKFKSIRRNEIEYIDKPYERLFNRVDVEDRPEGIIDRIDSDDLDLDVYELAGFYSRAYRHLNDIGKLSKQDNLTVEEKKKFAHFEYWVDKRYVYTFFIAVICALSQIYGVCIILWYQIRDLNKSDPKNYCYSGGFRIRAVLSTLLQIFLFEYSLALFFTNRGKSITYIRSSLLKDVCRCPIKMLSCFGFCNVKKYDQKNKKIASILYDPYWVTIGVHINNGTFVLVSITSAFLIYSTNDPIDLILNCVALFFISEIDNLLVGENDKERLKTMFEWYRRHNKFTYMDPKPEKDLVAKQKERKEHKELTTEDIDKKEQGTEQTDKEKKKEESSTEEKEDDEPKQPPLKGLTDFKPNKCCVCVNAFYMDVYNYIVLPVTFCLWVATPIWNMICY